MARVLKSNASRSLTSSRSASHVFQFFSSISLTPRAPKLARIVLFRLEKTTRPRPSNSSNRTGGGGFRGVIRTTDDSTLGGGRKLDLPTLRMCSTWEKSWTFAERRHHIGEPGGAHNRRANSRWNMRTQVLGTGREERSLKTRGEEI